MLCGLAILLVPATAQAKRNLYVANADSSSVAAFDLNAAGQPIELAGSPFASGAFYSEGTSITPDGTHLYVANGSSNNVSAFAIAASGSLIPVPGSPFAAGGFPRITSISPDGSHLYVTNGASNDISAFAIAADGALSAVPGSPFSAGTGPLGIAISPDGGTLYATNADSSSNKVSAYAIAPSGALSEISGSPFTAGTQPRGISISPDGSHVYVTNRVTNDISAFAIAPGGGLSPVPGSPFVAGSGMNTQPAGISISPDGVHLYVTEASDDVAAYTIAADGSLSTVAGSPFATGMSPVATTISPDGSHLYVANVHAPATVSAFAIAPGGALTQILGSPFGSGGVNPLYQALAITPNQPPAASFTAGAAVSGEPASFDAASSTDPDGAVAAYVWDFGDGSSVAVGSPQTTHVYASSGTYTAKLTLTDNEGCSASFVYTGQTAYCNGGPSAATSQQVTVAKGKVLNPSVTAKKTQRQHGKTIKIKVKAGAGEAVDLVGKGKVTVKKAKKGHHKGGKGKGGTKARKKAKSFALKTVKKSVGAHKRTILRLKPKKRRDSKKIFRLLKKGVDLRANPSVKLTDVAGNSVTEKRVVRLKLKRPSRHRGR